MERKAGETWRGRKDPREFDRDDGVAVIFRVEEEIKTLNMTSVLLELSEEEWNSFSNHIFHPHPPIGFSLAFMPPKKSSTAPAVSTRVTRSARQSQPAASVSIPSPSTTDASESIQNSRFNSVASSPNSSFCLSKLKIDSDDESNDPIAVKDENDDEDDFLPSKVITMSAVALGKRRLVEVQLPLKSVVSPRGVKRTRNSGSIAQGRSIKIEAPDEKDTLESDLDDFSEDESMETPLPPKSAAAKKSRRAKSPSITIPAASSSSTTARQTVMKPSRAASKKASAAVAAQIKKESDSSDDDDEDEFKGTSDDNSPEGNGSEIESGDGSSDSSSSGEEAPVIVRRGNRARGSRLTWMEKVNLQLLEHHPELANVWDELDKVGVQVPEAAEQPDGLKLKLLPFQREGLGWMRKQEKSLDEMGMGKTIQMISLLLSQPGKPNLIIAPTVAIIQWIGEIADHAPSLKALMFHGPNRTESMRELMSYDIVITTYSIIESGYRKQKYGFKRGGMTVKEDSLLHRIKWHRIILDEAHNIKERSCNTARSAFALQSETKWCLSGTPMQNRVGELYSLIRFMEADPYGHVCWWNNEILKPIQNFGAAGVGEMAFQKLRKLLDRIMLRRTKVERADDLGLPPRKLTVSRYLFNEEEEDLYESLFSDSKRKFSTYVEQNTVLNNYANIFELLTKMRQMVDHPDLVLKKIKPGQVGLPETMVCSICQEEAEDPIVSKCHHLFCREDAQQYISTAETEAPECPVCHIPLSVDLQQPTYVNEVEEATEVKHKNFARTSIVNRINMDTWRSSTKIEALVEQLYNLQREDRSTKSICFSQYVTFLDLIKWRLEKAGFKCVKLDGHMTPTQRAASIKKFSEDPTVTVFLISLKAGGVALNLTAASRVFICDPWWNPAAELQAMDRIHRIGQHRPILITRIIIENSIESRILQLQEKKQAMVDSTIGKDPAALARLTTEDLRFLFVN
ncbi:DNA repair protein rad16 [Mortierella sp. AM989]|nr:DNA repair protein rad16 [Mortierella sp. AM989]